jgi:hypothetical protein
MEIFPISDFLLFVLYVVIIVFIDFLIVDEFFACLAFLDLAKAALAVADFISNF